MKKKILKTENLDQKFILPRPRKNKAISTRSKRVENMNDVEYCRIFIDALPEADLAKLREKIQKIIDARKPSWWKCSNCGVVQKRSWDAEETSCIHCNQYSKQAGGQLVKMSDAETKKYLKETAERQKKERDQRLKGELARANQARKEQGKDEITMAELKARKKRYWERMIPKN